MLKTFIIRFLINLLSIFPTIPNIDSSLLDTIHDYLTLITTHGGRLLGVFVRLSTVQLIIPIYLVILAVDVFYKIIRWIINKLPINVS